MGKELQLESLTSDRQRIGQDCWFMQCVFFPLIEEWRSQAIYCLSLMNNTNKCEKGKKCNGQWQPQRKQTDMKTKQVFPVHWTSVCRNHHLFKSWHIAVSGQSIHRVYTWQAMVLLWKEVVSTDLVNGIKASGKTDVNFNSVFRAMSFSLTWCVKNTI